MKTYASNGRRRPRTLAEQAEVLPDAELQRHASVSTSNRHYCRDCFCCACVDELNRRRENRKP